MLAIASPYTRGMAERWVTVQNAAKAVGIHEQTVWRYLRLGHLERRKSAPGTPRRTLVDLNKLRSLRDNPPPAEL